MYFSKGKVSAIGLTIVQQGVNVWGDTHTFLSFNRSLCRTRFFDSSLHCGSNFEDGW